MRQFFIIAIFSVATILSGCDNVKAPKQDAPVVASTLVDFRIINWGPQSTNVNMVPNLQPGGRMGIWIEVSGVQTLGDVQVLFDGRPAMATSVQENIITAAIAPELLALPGRKEVVIKQIMTSKLFPVGVFDVQPAK